MMWAFYWEPVMDDLRLYEQILGLDEPWLVEAVDLDLAGGKVIPDVIVGVRFTDGVKQQAA